MDEKEFEKKMNKLRKESEKFAKETGIKVNPDKKIADGIIKGLILNEEKHGEQYCPCRRVTGNEEEDKKIICPCVYHKEEIEKDGVCHCRLFVKA